MKTNTTGTDGPAQSVLMLGIGSEILAIQADLVREIIDPVAATPVAGARTHLPAVINVRGNIMPLADLRIRFGMPTSATTPDSRIVVVELVLDQDTVAVGLMADKVHEVTTLSPADLQATPQIGLRWPTAFIRGLARWNDRFVIVPELERILA